MFFLQMQEVFCLITQQAYNQLFKDHIVRNSAIFFLQNSENR